MPMPLLQLLILYIRCSLFPNEVSLQCSLQGNLKRDITERANRKVFSSSFLPVVLPSQATHVCFGIEKDSTAEKCKSRRTFSFL